MVHQPSRTTGGAPAPCAAAGSRGAHGPRARSVRSACPPRAPGVHAAPRAGSPGPARRRPASSGCGAACAGSAAWVSWSTIRASLRRREPVGAHRGRQPVGDGSRCPGRRQAAGRLLQVTPGPRRRARWRARPAARRRDRRARYLRRAASRKGVCDPRDVAPGAAPGGGGAAGADVEGHDPRRMAPAVSGAYRRGFRKPAQLMKPVTTSTSRRIAAASITAAPTDPNSRPECRSSRTRLSGSPCPR